MIRSVLLALALLGAPLSYAAPLASPFSNSVYPAQTFTASNQTGSAIQLNGLTVPSNVGSSYASGIITVTGTSLTTATFTVMGSSDGGATYFALPIINPLAAPSSSAPATAVTVTANGTYQVSLAGITHVQFVTSSAFTATALSLTLTASPNGQVSRNRGGGSFTPPSGSGNQAYMTPDGSSGPAVLRSIAPSDLPAATSSTLGTVKPDGSTCTVTAGVLTCTGGTGGGGSVGTGPNGAVGGYVNAGTGNGVLPLPKLYYINQTMTLAQINAVFAAADVHSIVLIGEDVPLNLQWTNPNGARVHDLRKGMNPFSYAQAGVACDYVGSVQNLTITAGSNLVNIGADPYPVGGNLVFAKKTGFGLNAVQQAWEPKIVSFSNPNATLSGPAPFSYTGPVGYGTINTIPMNALFAAAGANAIQLPSGCRALTGTINWNGTSIIGGGFSASALVGLPGQDILQSTNSASGVTGLVTTNFSLAPDTTFDATLGYIQWSDDGSTSTVIPPVYRPVLNNTLMANRPLSEQWATGASNGVAAITGGSAVMCVPNALTRTPPNGQLIVFPYLPISTLFNTTVLNQTGGGCPGGSTGVTLNANVPTLPAPTTTILNTTFTEGAASAPLAGTTPSTCASGCAGPWTLAGGPDWTYNGGGGGITQAGTQTNADLITIGTPQNYTITMVVGQIPTGGAKQVSLYAEYADVNNALQIDLAQGFQIQCFQYVSGVRTSVCSPLGAPTAGTYTLTFTGSNFTLVTPVGTTGGTIFVSGNKIGLAGQGATSIVTSLNVTQQVYNFNQAYYETATAFDVGNTTIPTSITYPLVITDSLIKAPTPRQTWSSPLGHVIIGNNSVRMEANYLGNNNSATPGSGQITLREGPATIGSALTAGSYFIIPANPCTAEYETPPYVNPNINGANSVTPAGAIDIPGDCVGNAAMAFLQPDGTHPFTGTVNAFMGPILVYSSTGVNQGQNRTAARLEQGNTNGYSVAWPGWKIEQMEYGLVQGPASFNEYGEAATLPNSINNSITNCQIRAAYPLVFTFWQQSIIDGCDTYTNYFNPYDGTAVGAWLALSMSYAVNEQTGGAITFSSQNHTTRWQSEPENGTHTASAPYSYLDCPACVFDTDVFEGGFNIFRSPSMTVQNSSIALPVIDWTIASKFTNNNGVNPYYFTNNWVDSVFQWFNWGSASSCDVLMGNQGGQPCASGYGAVTSGKSGVSSVTGINGVENIEGGNIRPGEMGFFTSFQPPVTDSTEPYWSKYVACFNVGSACQENFFGGNFHLYIGPHNRIAPLLYNLEVTVKQTTGSPGTFQFLFGAQDDGSGSCASAGQFGLIGVPITTSWATQTVPVDFRGRQGCYLQFIVQTLANPVLLGEINFIPQSNSLTITPPSDSIYNTACKVSGTDYGVSATGYRYVCVAGTIKRLGPFS